MAELQFPSLADAIAAVVRKRWETSADRFIRVSVPRDLPVKRALALLKPDLKRVAALAPFSASDAPTGVAIAASASDATSWRNESFARKRANPTVVLGYAKGADEAGLATTRALVRLDDVLTEWRSSLMTWVQSRVHSQAPGRLVAAIFDRYESFEFKQIDAYFERVLSQPSDYATSMPAELWHLRLFPDAHILDANQDTARRLDLNVETRRKLSLASDSKSDQNRIQRLETLATEGSQTASTLLAFRTSQHPELLREIQL